MKRLTMLVTSDGQWVLEDSAEFLAALGDPDPDYDAASFAVKNLGFIKFQILDGSVVEIELHPRNVQLPALLAVQQQLVVVPSPVVSNKILRYGLALGNYDLGRTGNLAPLRVMRA